MNKAIKGNTNKQPNKCRDCIYLNMDDKTHSVGYPCGRPNHVWRTMTAHLKYAHTPACKAFKPRKGQTNEQS